MLNNLKIILKNLFPDKIFLRIFYFKIHSKYLDLNNPLTLNEKLQWLKLHDRTTLHTMCADKINVRKYVINKIGEQYLIPLYFTTNNINDLNESNINQFPCIIKANHSSGSVFVLKDRNDLTTSFLQQIKDSFSKQLKTNYYWIWREWQYKNINPKILIEKLLLDEKNQIPKDYKFHCINGRVEFIQIDLDRFDEHKRSIFSREWELLDFQWSPVDSNGITLFKNGGYVEKPFNLIKMIELAETLARDFLFTRIDLYILGNKIYFGEITFHPGAGFEKFIPDHWDKFYGNKLKLQS